MSTYLRIFGVVFVVAAVFVIGSALITGSIHIKGMRAPILRRERPRDYWFVVVIALFFASVLTWVFLTS